MSNSRKKLEVNGFLQGKGKYVPKAFYPVEELLLTTKPNFTRRLELQRCSGIVDAIDRQIADDFGESAA
jgi:hypothetical protein